MQQPSCESERGAGSSAVSTFGEVNRRTRFTVSESFITKLVPVEMVHYTHSVFSECQIRTHVAYFRGKLTLLRLTRAGAHGGRCSSSGCHRSACHSALCFTLFARLLSTPSGDPCSCSARCHARRLMGCMLLQAILMAARCARICSFMATRAGPRISRRALLLPITFLSVATGLPQPGITCE